MRRNSSPFIYIRVLRHADHTVFSVQDGQKFYYDPQFGTKMAYSSGQQVKRSILEELTTILGVPQAPITFNWEIDNKGKTEQKEPHSPCDPSYPDQLIGGYMKAESGDYTVKRRSPLSISAMRPLHPRLGGLEGVKENLTFDRTSYPEGHILKVSKVNSAGKREEISTEDLNEWLTSNKRTLPNRKWIPDHTRASGLFVFDLAIDLRTLFCVSLNKLEPELRPEVESKLREEGWIEGKNVFGSCLVCPPEKRAEIIPALSNAILNWRITSNQSRTFSLMETLAVAISDNANQISYAIRGELKEDTGERQEAIAKLDETARAELYITPACKGYISGVTGSIDALDKAEASLISKIEEFMEKNL